jgi:hypothetical protein
MRRITGVKYLVEIEGRQYIAAWKSPYRVSLHERGTLKMVARHTPNSNFGAIQFDTIAAASDRATKFTLEAVN